MSYANTGRPPVLIDTDKRRRHSPPQRLSLVRTTRAETYFLVATRKFVCLVRTENRTQ